MYYILNETNQIIAVDTDVLELCGLTHIDQLTLSIALGDTQFTLLSEENLVITADNNNKTYPVSKISLSSMLGRLTLVEIKIPEEETEDILSVFKIDDMEKSEEDIISMVSDEEDSEDIISMNLDEEETEDIISMDLDSELLSIKTDSDETSLITETLEDDNALFDLSPKKEEETPTVLSDDTDTLDLDFFIKEEEEEAPKDEPAIDEHAEILIDIEKVSQRIGISKEDYNTFLNEYIDTALDLEKDLQSADAQKRKNAIATLSHLSDLLQLPLMTDIIAKIDAAQEDNQREIIDIFYATLSRITTSGASQTFEKELKTEESEIEEPKIELFDLAEETKPAAEINKNGFGSISLEGIKPIHFDFRLEEAANDLSLPVDLIEEFVHDFIEQGHIETEKMLKAYEKGDLDAIQKIGHLLKGASSNLRINALSDTLYKIQFCEDSSNLEHYIKDYWGHFLSFEIQINALAK